MSESILQVTDEVVDFLYAEARLLDDHDYDAWLELWDDDGRYVIPTDGDASPKDHVALINDDRRRLGMRVAQLQTGYRHAQLPQSRTQHYITNIEASGPDDDRLLRVVSSYLVVEARVGEINLWPGRATHLLRHADDGSLRLVGKKVVLINNDVPVPSMGFLL